MSASLHGDVASAIGQQVEQMILQAKKDSEARVRHELNVARQQLQQMEAHVNELTERVSRCVRSNGSGAADPSQTVDRVFLSTKIKQLEDKWGNEVKALKQDLHRTILAHNHNSDLMRHHRDALDEARRKLDTQTQPKAEQVDQQIEKVDRMLRAGQAKQRALDAVTERLTALEGQVNELLPNPAAMSGAYGGMMPPGVSGMAGLSGAPGLGAAAPKKAAKKESEGPPSEEEVRNRLLQAARGGAAAATSFNAEAPAFVPGGAVEGSAGAKPAAAGDAGAPVTLAMPTSPAGEEIAESPGNGNSKEAGSEAAAAAGDGETAAKEES
eukprot:TRINITY_DN4296_c0_g1_i1.p1 TRINITY_DN4296_c0_g1~~TRINITY_DN4296_c0_g1_i1.p1  ORF type:complete len:326 (-),score=79.92 TRINITY_DN4296_c0_g1_i1:704-1681(-)